VISRDEVIARVGKGRFVVNHNCPVGSAVTDLYGPVLKGRLGQAETGLAVRLGIDVKRRDHRARNRVRASENDPRLDCEGGRWIQCLVVVNQSPRSVDINRMQVLIREDALLPELVLPDCSRVVEWAARVRPVVLSQHIKRLGATLLSEGPPTDYPRL